jgi:DNA-binding MarR family transcriptional regulator
VEAVADRLHSAALHLLRRLRTPDDPLISAPRLSAMSVIALAGPIGIGALAAAEGVSAPTMSRLVDALERDGLVRRRPDTEDARGVLVTVTPKGRTTLQRGRAKRLRALTERLHGLSADELTAVSGAAELIERLASERPPGSPPRGGDQPPFDPRP